MLVRKYLSENVVMNCGFESKEHCKAERGFEFGETAQKGCAHSKEAVAEDFSLPKMRQRIC